MGSCESLLLFFGNNPIILYLFRKAVSIKPCVCVGCVNVSGVSRGGARRINATQLVKCAAAGTAFSASSSRQADCMSTTRPCFCLKEMDGNERLLVICPHLDTQPGCCVSLPVSRFFFSFPKSPQLLRRTSNTEQRHPKDFSQSSSAYFKG